jgi:hypothetical protein
MEVEVVRWPDKTDMDKIVNKSFSNEEEAHTYYTNWNPPEYNDSKFIVQGWNNNKKEIETPDNYIYTYSVNLWFENEMQHSHNFTVYKSPN